MPGSDREYFLNILGVGFLSIKIFIVFLTETSQPPVTNTGEEITCIISSNVKLQGSNYSSAISRQFSLSATLLSFLVKRLQAQ